MQKRLSLIIIFGLFFSLLVLPFFADAALPAPNHPIMFGYYKVESNYGFYLSETKNYTDTELIETFDFFRPAPNSWNDQAGFDRAFTETIAAGHKIIYGPDTNNLDLSLDKAKPYWSNVNWIYLADEPSWDKATTESQITAFKNAVSQKGLAQKPIAINFTQQQILTGTGFQASNLDIVGTEAYIDPTTQNSSNLVTQLNNQIDQLKQKIGHRKMFLVMQAYDRNGTWTNINSLVSIQTPVYLKAYNDPNVIGIFMFSYARKGGTRDHPELKAEHQKIAQALGLSANPPLPPPPPPGLVCDPLPDDPQQLLECIFWIGINPPSPPPPPNPGDPGNPVGLGVSATWGIGAAYNPTNDTLFVAHADTTRVRGMLVNAKDLSIKVPDQQIDTGKDPLVSGSPITVYNSKDNKFFVIWNDERPNAGRYHIWGRFISGSGQPLGSDFLIVTDSRIALASLTYDSTNNKYPISYSLNNHAYILTVDANGNISSSLDLGNGGAGFGAGKTSVAFDLDDDQYWITYVANNLSALGSKIMFQKVDAKTLQPVGGLTQLSNATVAKSASIAYSSNDHAAVAVWMENAGIQGVTITSNSISSQFPVITANTQPYSSGYSGPVLAYSPWTGTFFVSSQDGSGGIMLTEFDSSGFVYETNQPLPPASKGNFNSTIVATVYGTSVLASTNNTSLSAVKVASTFALGPAGPPPPPPGPAPVTAPVDTTALPKQITQIYVWSLGIAAILAVLMSILGGYLVMTAQGNAQQSSQGKSFLISSITGLVLLFGAYILLNTINPNLVNLNLSSINNLNQPIPPPPPAAGVRAP